MFERIRNEDSEDRSIRSNSDAEQLQHGSRQGNLLSISNELNNDIQNERSGNKDLIGNGNNNLISNEDSRDLIKGIDKLPDEDKSLLIDNLDQIADDEEDQQPGVDNLDWIPTDDASDTQSELNNSMRVNRPKHRNVSSSKTDKKSESSKKPAGQPAARNINDLQASEEEMKPIRGWNFDPVAFPERRRPSGSNKFVSRLAYYSGKTVGKVLGFLSNLVFFPLTIYQLGRRFGHWLSNRSGLQEKKNHKAIPGWGGAKWELEPHNPNELNIDFRRVPAVWSYSTVDEAEKAPGVPRDPVFSLYISQPESGVDLNLNERNDTGHSGIGIEFSRYSKITRKWERYNLRYGFFPQGGLPDVSREAILGFHQATIPGQLADERGRGYDISRSYKMENRQINAVLKASETYADKGYNNYTRNCTTFAKDMSKIAGVSGADSFFRQEEIEYTNKANKQMFMASMATMHSKAAFGAGMTKLTHGNDYNYQGFGNKRATKQDYDRYKNSLSYFKSRPDKADLPNGAVENLRRDSRWITGGQIGKFEDQKYLLDDVQDRLPDKCQALLENLRTITPDGKLDGEIPAELRGILDLLENPDRVTVGIEPKLYTRTELKQIRGQLTDMVQKLNTLLLKYYKNDPRIHYQVLDMISLLNNGIKDADEKNEANYLEDYNVGGGDLGSLRFKMMNKKMALPDQEGEHPLELTPSELEGWMQVYKTPQEAIAQAKRYNELFFHYDRTDAEQKEFYRLERISELAKDFSKSHRYMLERDEYSQQDMDYAFSLEKKEKMVFSDDFLSDGKTSSAVYQSLFLEKVFEGMKERAETFINEQHISENGNMDALQEWLDTDMSEKIKGRRQVMFKIVRAMDKALNYPSREELLDRVLDLIKNRWITRLFTGAEQNNQNELLINTSENGHAGDGPDRLLRDAYDGIAEGGKMSQQLDAIVYRVISQRPLAVPQNLMLINN